MIIISFATFQHAFSRCTATKNATREQQKNATRKPAALDNLPPLSRTGHPLSTPAALVSLRTGHPLPPSDYPKKVRPVTPCAAPNNPDKVPAAGRIRPGPGTACRPARPAVHQASFAPFPSDLPFHPRCDQAPFCPFCAVLRVEKWCVSATFFIMFTLDLHTFIIFLPDPMQFLHIMHKQTQRFLPVLRILDTKAT